MSEERCPVDNMNLCGVHWHRDKGDVLWNKNKSLIYNWCTIIQQLLMPSIILFKLVKKKNLSHPKSIKFAYVQQGKKQENIIFALQIT